MMPVLIRETAALRALEPAWGALWRRLPDASPFTAPAWLLPWWDAFAPGDLFVAAVLSGGRLLALAPLYREEGVLGRRLLPLGIGLSDEADILVDPAAPEAAALLLDRLHGARAEWDYWSAEELAPGAAALALATPAAWRSACAPQSACPVLALGGTADGVARAVPAGRRRKWRMARHRAARRGARLTRATGAGVAPALDALVRLHGDRWAARGETGVLADERVRRFHAAAAPALDAAGLLRLLTLELDGRVAGVFYGLQAGRTACAYLGGFDPAFAFESPGTVLLGAALEAAAAEGVTCFSFLRGQEPYKYDWGARDRWNHRRLFEPLR